MSPESQIRNTLLIGKSNIKCLYWNVLWTYGSMIILMENRNSRCKTERGPILETKEAMVVAFSQCTDAS